jgi:hypothetical protein
MRSRPTSSRRLFLLLLAAIAAVFLIGRLWIQREHGVGPTEATLIPAPPDR